jgi:COMPASS component SWD2
VVPARIRLQAGKINCLDFHRKEDLLVTSSEDDSIRLYNITSAT